MQEPTKKHHTDNDTITLKLKVRRKNAAKVEEFARKIEAGEGSTYTVAEVFPDLVGKEKTIALRAYRTREDLTQRELAEKVGHSSTTYLRDGDRQACHRQGDG